VFILNEKLDKIIEENNNSYEQIFSHLREIKSKVIDINKITNNIDKNIKKHIDIKEDK
jgi:hypothetical protein